MAGPSWGRHQEPRMETRTRNEKAVGALRMPAIARATARRRPRPWSRSGSAPSRSAAMRPTRSRQALGEAAPAGCAVAPGARRGDESDDARFVEEFGLEVEEELEETRAQSELSVDSTGLMQTLGCSIVVEGRRNSSADAEASGAST
mmetsp:Transcript_38028/g.122261  ORF Transcript_38028/g.122261 Transcript_38028/m.122261 type:complete len:147 (+) Transcript_38028:288-728(+)